MQNYLDCPIKGTVSRPPEPLSSIITVLTGGWLPATSAALQSPIDCSKIDRMKANFSDRNVPLGPLDQILVDEQTGRLGRCIGSFWPHSGAIGAISVELRTSSGATRELPWISTRPASPEEREEFLRQSRGHRR